MTTGGQDQMPTVEPATLCVSRPEFTSRIAGVESAVRLHIDRGDDLNARDRGEGLTPLMRAAFLRRVSQPPTSYLRAKASSWNGRTPRGIADSGSP